MENLVQSVELLDDLPAFLPCWEPGETLFSLSARYHRMIGGGAAYRSSEQLFGCRTAGLKHDFPCHIDRFSAITGGLLGTAESIVLERTLLQYYAPFLGVSKLIAATNLMRGSSVSTLKNLLGILPSRIGAGHPLKACDECIKVDREIYGVSLWHLEQQWPSSWICRTHGNRLKQLASDVSAVGFDKWLLPQDASPSAWVRHSVGNGADAQALTRIVDASAGFVASRGVAFDARILRHAYLTAARAKEFLASDGSVRLPIIRKAFLDYFRAIMDLPPFHHLLSVQGVNAGVIGRLLRQHPGQGHPLKHSLMVAFLFDSFEDFLTAYKQSELAAQRIGPEEIQQQLATDLRVRLKWLVEKEHQTLSEAARALRISDCIGSRWARKDRVEYKGRPRVLNKELEANLRLQLAEGTDLSVISSRLLIRKGFIRSYTAKDVELRLLWREARAAKQLDGHRQAFLSIVADHQGWTLKALRRIPKNGVSWLVRHDRDWLSEHLPNPICGLRDNIQQDRSGTSCPDTGEPAFALTQGLDSSGR